MNTGPATVVGTGNRPALDSSCASTAGRVAGYAAASALAYWFLPGSGSGTGVQQRTGIVLGPAGQRGQGFEQAATEARETVLGAGRSGTQCTPLNEGRCHPAGEASGSASSC